MRALGHLTLFLFAGVAPALADAPAMALLMEPAQDRKYEHFAFAPPHAVRCGESGTVVLDVRIDPDGVVAAASIVEKSAFADLDVTARQAVLGWRYHPSKTALRRTEKVVFQADTRSVRTGECSTEATRAYAAALAEAPVVIAPSMPKGMSPPALLGPKDALVDLDPSDGKACSEDATTLTMYAVVAADGTVRKVEPWEPAGTSAIPRSAYALAQTLRFTPAKRNGEPVPVTLSIFVTPRPAGSRCRLLVE